LSKPNRRGIQGHKGGGIPATSTLGPSSGKGPPSGKEEGHEKTFIGPLSEGRRHCSGEESTIYDTEKGCKRTKFYKGDGGKFFLIILQEGGKAFITILLVQELIGRSIGQDKKGELKGKEGKV